MIDFFLILIGFFFLLIGANVLKLKWDSSISENEIRTKKKKLIILGVFLLICAFCKFLFVHYWYVYSELKNSQKAYETDLSKLDSGVYVVFMGDGNKSYTKDHEHAGLLFLNDDGSVDFYHSSSKNPNSLSIVEHYVSVKSFESDFAYDSFYYQEVHWN